MGNKASGQVQYYWRASRDCSVFLFLSDRASWMALDSWSHRVDVHVITVIYTVLFTATVLLKGVDLAL